MKIYLLMNMKMLTIVGIFIFISKIFHIQLSSLKMFYNLGGQILNVCKAHSTRTPTSVQSDQSLFNVGIKKLHSWLSKLHPIKILIRLDKCAG